METGNVDNFKHLIKVVNTVWAIEDAKFTQLMKLFDQKLNGGDISTLLGAEGWEVFKLSPEVASMTVDGVLVPTTMGAQPICGMVPTFAMEAKIRELEDMGFKTLILELDTPGGVVTGIPELADTIKDSSMEVIVFSKEMCCSAGMWIASAADKFFCTKSARVGSIGVRLAVTKKSQDDTYETYNFTGGKEKLYGDPAIPMTEEEKEYFEYSVKATYDWFTFTVAENRGVEESKVRETEARTYMGKDAPDFLVDDIVTINDFRSFILENL